MPTAADMVFNAALLAIPVAFVAGIWWATELVEAAWDLWKHRH